MHPRALLIEWTNSHRVDKEMIKDIIKNKLQNMGAKFTFCIRDDPRNPHIFYVIIKKEEAVAEFLREDKYLLQDFGSFKCEITARLNSDYQEYVSYKLAEFNESVSPKDVEEIFRNHGIKVNVVRRTSNPQVFKVYFLNREEAVIAENNDIAELIKI